MALKGDRTNVQQDISMFMNQVAERGGVAVLSTGGSGIALDQSVATVTYSASYSGTLLPVGILMNDMVNLDLTRQHINFHRDEVQMGGKVTLLQRGTVVTNMTSGTMTSCAGKDAYLANYGRVTQTKDFTAQPRVGSFLSNPDENGFVKLLVNIG